MTLKLLPPAFGRKVLVGTLEVVAGPIGRAPFPIDAFVLEEDTYRILNATNTLHETCEHPVRTLTEAFLFSPARPGTVITTGRHPLYLHAIVHDLDQNPTWREEWIKSCLQTIFHEVGKRNLMTLALPILGTVHGSFSTLRFMEFLRETLDRSPVPSLKRLWLIGPAETILAAIENSAPLLD